MEPGYASLQRELASKPIAYEIPDEIVVYRYPYPLVKTVTYW